MNERIQELAEQAGLNATLLFNKEKLEKFSELIVKDCADFVRESYDHAGAEGIAWYMEIKYGLHGDYA